jgi:hypothetical protein
MAPITPVGVPAQIVAGDTVKFTVSYSDYPISESWTLAIRLAGAAVLEWDAAWLTDDGNVWTVTIPATKTQTLNSSPGVYRWFADVTGSGAYAGEKYTVADGTIVVTANPRQAQNGDFQSQEEKDLAVVEAAIANNLTDGMKAYTIKGRQVVLMDHSELLAERSRLKRAVWRLKHPGKFGPVLQRVYHGPG